MCDDLLISLEGYFSSSPFGMSGLTRQTNEVETVFTSNPLHHKNIKLSFSSHQQEAVVCYSMSNLTCLLIFRDVSKGLKVSFCDCSHTSTY